MRSAVRWYEDAVTGKLGRLHVHEALDRSVRKSRNRSELPAGLWTLSRHGPAGRTAWSGVPTRLSRAGLPPNGSSDDIRIHAGLPETSAAVRLTQEPVQTSPISALSRPLPGVTATRSPIAAPGASGPQRGGTVQRPGQKPVVTAAPMIVSRRATAASLSAVPVAAARPSLAEQAGSIPSAAVSALPNSSLTRSAALDAALATSLPRTSRAGQAVVGIGKPAQGSAVAYIGMPAGSRTGVPPASPGIRRSGPADRVLQVAAGKVEPGPGGLPVGTASAPPSWSAASTDHLAGGLPGAGESVMSSLQGKTGDPAGRSSFRDQAAGGQDIVPRRAAAPDRSGSRSEVREADQRAGRTSVPLRAGSGGEPIAMAGNRGSTGRGQAAPAATLVALHGDVMLDGRKMGRMVASGQTSAASLPTVSASAVNLRAVPIFTGTRIPL